MKYKIGIIVILFFLVFTTITLAQTQVNIILEKEQIEKEEEISFKIQIIDIQIAACTLEIYFDQDKLEYSKGPENSNYSNNRIVATWFSENGKNQDKLEIGNFVLKAKEEGTASIVVTGEFYNENGESIKIDNKQVSVKIGNQEETILNEKLQKQEETISLNEELPIQEESNQTNPSSANLKVLRLNQEGISPQFQKEVKQYYIVVNHFVENLDVTAISENEKASVTITGNKNLQLGKNTITIHVVSEDGTKEENYQIFVTKTQNIEAANTNLETLAIQEAMLYPSFDNNTLNYEANIPFTTEKINLLAIAQNPNAKVEIQGNGAMQVGDNVVKVVVTATDGITNKIYEIVVHRRNEEEQTQYEEETKVEAEKLSTILEEQEANSKKEEIQEEQKENAKWWILGVIVAIALIGGILYIVRKRKNID